jgi:protein O-GlcNAc transferase
MATENTWETAIQLHKAGAVQDAAMIYENILRKNPEDARAMFMLGKLRQEAGDLRKAAEYFQTAAQLEKNWLEPAAELVRTFAANAQFQDVDLMMAALALNHAHNARFHELSSEILLLIGNPKAAVTAIATAATCANADGNTYLLFGDQLRNAGEFLKAIEQYAKSAVYEETRSAALINAAGSYQIVGDFSSAVSKYGEVDRSSTADGSWLVSYIEALRQADQIDQWLYEIANLPAPTKTTPTGLRLVAERAQFMGQFRENQEAIHALNISVTKEDPLGYQEAMLVRLQFDAVSEEHRVFYRNFSSHFPTNLSENIGRNAQSSQSAKGAIALRVGYIGADFRDHVMGRMALSIIENRTRATHKAYCYALNSSEDATSARFISESDGYRRCASADDIAISKQIVADKIDILIDLSGPTAGTRPGVLARKPAPVIITHVGAAGPIGLSAVDYKLTDSICDLPENQEYLIEKLLPMDGCCYPVPKYPLPTQGLTKTDLQLDGKVVIGAFYTYMKLSERCVKLWKRVLDEIPNGVLLFSPLDPKLKVAYENIMRAADIPAAQFRYIPAGPTEAERLARYRVVDFVLDSMPYGGVNGTLEALYMGVPVVTLLGKHHSERTTTSMLTHLGVPDTVAQTPDEYIAHAKRIATDPAWSEDLSSRIRARWPKFADPTDYARRWEALLRKVAR